MKTLYFITGLPRTGATFLCNLLRQNPDIHGEPLSSLCSIYSNILAFWDKPAANIETDNSKARDDVLKAVLNGYYASQTKDVVFDKDLMWIKHIASLEALWQKRVKMLVMVRNPAEILASFEKLRNKDPLKITITDSQLGETSTIATRAYYFSNPNGMLGMPFQAIKDAHTMGYLDRLLFVDYNKFCNSPKSQIKRIYEFFDLPLFTHNINKIEQLETYNDFATKLPGTHVIKPKVDRTTVNPVVHIGLDLYQQYNREIFWDAWI